MKTTRILLVLVLFCIPHFLMSQNNLLYETIEKAKLSGSNFKKINSVFSYDNINSKQSDISDKFLNAEDIYYLKYDNSTVKKMENTISIVIPLRNQNIELELVDFSDKFNNYEVITSDGRKFSANKSIKHYRGIVKNDFNSLVAISFLEDEVIGMIAMENGNYNISYDKKSGNHIFFKDTNLKKVPEFICTTIDDYSFDYEPNVLSATLKSISNLESKIVSFYFETEQDIFITRGNVSSVEGFVTGIYNQVAVLYQRENIQTKISEIFIWTTADPYTATTTSGLLAQFQNTRTNIHGDLGHLLTFRNIGGGQAAGFEGLCNQSTSQKLAVSMLYNTYQSVANYSWSVFVIAHEFGHLFGSRHTHACVWNGNNTAIDGCANTEGGCAKPGIPLNGGTIMSYCHLQNVGVNFNLGFGLQPGNIIRSNIDNCIHHTISGPSIICDQAIYTISNLSEDVTVVWSTPYPNLPFPQLIQNSPETNQCTITNRFKYPLTTVLTAYIYMRGSLIHTLTKTIASSDNSTVQYGNYTQEACTFYGVSHPSISGNLKGEAIFLHQGCLTEIYLNDMYGRTVTLASFTPPMYWSYNSAQNKLLLKLPYGSGGIPFSFNITGGCKTKTILFFSKSNNSNFTLSPNPATTTVTIQLDAADNAAAGNQTFSDQSMNKTTPSDVVEIQLWSATSLLRTYKTDQTTYQFSVSDLPKGIYFVRVIKDGETHMQKLLKK